MLNNFFPPKQTWVKAACAKFCSLHIASSGTSNPHLIKDLILTDLLYYLSC